MSEDRPDSVTVDAEDMLNLIDRIRTTHRKLKSSSVDFLDSMEERANIYEDVYVSPAQRRWLTGLADEASVEVDNSIFKEE